MTELELAQMAADAEARIADEWRSRAIKAEKLAAHWKVKHDAQAGRARVLLGSVLEDYERFQACRHGARTMPEDGGEEAFVLAIDQYRVDHGL